MPDTLRRSMFNVGCSMFALLCLLPTPTRAADAPNPKPFLITVVDQETGRGVPLVELATTNQVKFLTDSAGRVALLEPGLMNQRVWFSVASHGYEFPKDGFGFPGKALDVAPGGAATLKIKRLNIAQRLYRNTGEGIYRDTVLAGLKPPIDKPVLNAQVIGQDSIQRAIYKGKIYWFWGDTGRTAYPLGHFGMAGATSDLPGNGGLDPSVGVNLTYFTDDKGFSRPTVPGTDLRWADGFVVLKDSTGNDRLVAKCDVLKGLSQRVARKLIIWNDDKQAFDDLLPLDRDEPLCATGHPIRHTDGGVDYLYFGPCYPLLRAKADLESYKTPAAFEGFTPLKPGARYAADGSTLDRDPAGKIIWAWKKGTPPIDEKQQQELIKAGHVKPADAWFQLKDVETKTAMVAHNGSVNWNAFRKKWVMITSQFMGKPSMLGEIWYSEADQPHGPYKSARRILTHDRYSFYNPAHHPFFDQQGGRIIYFEGTYTYTFSRQEKEGVTPRYDYNQIMYSLDLADPRLKLPE